MSRKKWLPLVLLAAAILALAAALVLLRGGEKEEETTAGIPLFTCAAADVEQLTYRASEAELTLTKDAQGTWSLEEDPLLPIDQDVVAAMLESMTALQATRALEKDAEVEAMGFEAPQMELQLTAGGIKTALLVGDQNTMLDADYVRLDGSNTVYLVSAADLSGLCRTRRSLYATQGVTELSSDDLTGMTVQSGETTLRFTHDADGWTLTDEPELALDQDLVERMANTVCNLQTSWSITAPLAAEAYGLDVPDVTVTVTDGSTSAQCAFGASCEEDETLCYLMADMAPTVVYEVPVQNKQAFAYDRTALMAATAETADDVVAQYPVGSEDDISD